MTVSLTARRRSPAPPSVHGDCPVPDCDAARLTTGHYPADVRVELPTAPLPDMHSPALPSPHGSASLRLATDQPPHRVLLMLAFLAGLWRRSSSGMSCWSACCDATAARWL